MHKVVWAGFDDVASGVRDDERRRSDAALLRADKKHG
jgi:hypothetical protein